METQQKQLLIEKINTKAWMPLPTNIINECYKLFFEDESQWKEPHPGRPLYVIGLSENRYDYYWIYINNHKKEIQFISCVYDIDKPSKVIKKWNKDECRNILDEVKKYFKEHSDKENLIYLDEKIYKDL